MPVCLSGRNEVSLQGVVEQSCLAIPTGMDLFV